jgi:hypothetical protein
VAVSGALLDPDRASAVTGPVWIAAGPAGKPPGGEQPRRHDQAVSPGATAGDKTTRRVGQWLTQRWRTPRRVSDGCHELPSGHDGENESMRGV